MSTSRIDRYIPLARRYSARVVLFHEAVGARAGLHVTDVKVLRLLGPASMTAGELAAEAGLTGAAITALVDRLVASGYATRVRDEVDRRKVTITAVPQKVRQLDRLYDGQGAEMAKLLATYSAAEFDVICDFLTKSADVLADQAARLRSPA